MKVKGFISILRWVSVGLIFVAALLTGLQLVSYSRIRAVFPQGMVIAGVPVDGLDQQQAAERLVEAYGVPVELRYGNAVIQVKPTVLGFELDLESMMAAADLERVSQPFWTAFWDYLWNRMPKPDPVPLSSSVSEDRLRSYLKNEIVVRYDQPSIAAIPVAGSVNFSQGEQGTNLDIDRAVVLISDALRSPTSRVVNLTFNKAAPPRPSLQNLQILLQQIIDLAKFDGLAEIYMLDLENGQELSFAYRQGTNLTPGIAFTAASTMKIAIMTSIFRRIKEPAPPDITNLLELMIERSENDPADRLMEQVIDKNLGPLEVTNDLQTLGFQSTFLAGYFYPGAPLLKRFTTPANSRADVQTSPDPYNQTTPAEIGMLLDDIYQCAETGGGTFAAVFPGQISQNECRQMITYLTRNRIAVLIQAGLPEGTQIAHKHGWITENDGLIHHISDAGIVYTPGGDYVLALYLYHPVQILFDPVNQMVAQLSSAVYNYFNFAGK